VGRRRHDSRRERVRTRGERGLGERPAARPLARARARRCGERAGGPGRRSSCVGWRSKIRDRRLRRPPRSAVPRNAGSEHRPHNVVSLRVPYPSSAAWPGYGSGLGWRRPAATPAEKREPGEVHIQLMYASELHVYLYFFKKT
jgi:hypothetical protein